jgi:D-alanyl-lipoteichoic acid acyltransferase DltB (MBOAT superfamily)
MQPHGWVGSFAHPSSQPFPLEVWFETAFILIYIFFDFAGYSRIALGIGELFGVPTPDNFNKPFAATSVTDFWMRWHSSLGLFIRRNIFMPLQVYAVRRAGIRFSNSFGLFSLLTAFTFTGFWHRMGLHLTLWGLAMGIWLCMEKAVRDYCLRFAWARSKSAQSAARFVGPIYTSAIIIIGFRFVLSKLF